MGECKTKNESYKTKLNETNRTEMEATPTIIASFSAYLSVRLTAVVAT